jgi:hypothetical protein
MNLKKYYEVFNMSISDDIGCTEEDAFVVETADLMTAILYFQN